MIDDILKDIPGFEGLYAVTKDGRVYSYPKEWKMPKGGVRRHNGKWLRDWKHVKGYRCVELSKDNHKNKSFKVHTLVALAYIPNPLGLREVNHGDSNKANNHIDNLEWSTRSANVQYAFDNGLKHALRGENGTNHKLSDALVREIRDVYKTGSFDQYELAARYNVTQSCIYAVIARKSWAHVA